MTPHDSVLLAARIVVGGAFLIIGLRNIGARKAIAGMFAAFRFPVPGVLVVLGIAMQVGFGALMISGFYTLVAALGLLAFTVLATFMAHSFWTYPPADRPAQINAFLANLVMIGGLLALAAAAL